jgi:hypothetical protein
MVLFRAHGNTAGPLVISEVMNSQNNQDPDAKKGTVEPDRPEDDADSNMAELNEQLDHRFQDPMNKSSDSGMPGTGQTGEYSMEKEGEDELNRDTGSEPSLEKDAGRNQGGKKDDPLVA